jgi:hypothetical protein
VKRAALLASVLLLAGCGHHTRAVPPGAIAVVGTEPISRTDFDAELTRARLAYAARGQPFPQQGTDAYRRLRDSVVALLVDRATVEIEAKRARIAVDPVEVDARLRWFKQTTFGGDERRFREQLRRTAMTEADVRAALRTELLADKLRGMHTSRPEVVYARDFEPSSGR